jgi:hypothetical protein
MVTGDGALTSVRREGLMVIKIDKAAAMKPSVMKRVRYVE